MNKLTIVFDANDGMVLPDGKVVEFVQSTLKQLENSNIQLCIGSELLLLAFRYEVAKGMLPPANILLMVDMEKVDILPYGKLSSYPKCLTIAMDLTEQMMVAGVRRFTHQATK
jgi:hypothetical protein